MVFSSDRQQILQRADSPISAVPLRFFDIETSGVRPDRGARITEVAVLDREGVVMAWRGESLTGNQISALGDSPLYLRSVAVGERHGVLASGMKHLNRTTLRRMTG